MAWKGSEGEPIVALPADDIKWAQWLRVARNYQLRVGVKDHQKHHFDGFAREVRPPRVKPAKLTHPTPRITTS